MSRAERVVDVNVPQARQLLGKTWVVRLVFVVIAHVLQQEHVAGLQGCRGFLRLFTDAIIHECYRPAQKVGQFRSNRAQGKRGVPLAFGPSQMRHEHGFRALIDQQFDRRQRFLDARIVVDDHLPILFLHGHVEIHAHQNALPS